jgi:hypothetical protein
MRDLVIGQLLGASMAFDFQSLNRSIAQWLNFSLEL